MRREEFSLQREEGNHGVPRVMDRDSVSPESTCRGYGPKFPRSISGPTEGMPTTILHGNHMDSGPVADHEIIADVGHQPPRLSSELVRLPEHLDRVDPYALGLPARQHDQGVSPKLLDNRHSGGFLVAAAARGQGLHESRDQEECHAGGSNQGMLHGLDLRWGSDSMNATALPAPYRWTHIEGGNVGRDTRSGNKGNHAAHGSSLSPERGGCRYDGIPPSSICHVAKGQLRCHSGVIRSSDWR